MTTPSGETIHVLVNHFKSQSGGGGSKRERQAIAVRTIADQLTSAGEHVVVMGDLNEGPRREDNVDWQVQCTVRFCGTYVDLLKTMLSITKAFVADK